MRIARLSLASSLIARLSHVNSFSNLFPFYFSGLSLIEGATKQEADMRDEPATCSDAPPLHLLRSTATNQRQNKVCTMSSKNSKKTKQTTPKALLNQNIRIPNKKKGTATPSLIPAHARAQCTTAQRPDPTASKAVHTPLASGSEAVSPARHDNLLIDLSTGSTAYAAYARHISSVATEGTAVKQCQFYRRKYAARWDWLQAAHKSGMVSSPQHGQSAAEVAKGLDDDATSRLAMLYACQQVRKDSRSTVAETLAAVKLEAALRGLDKPAAVKQGAIDPALLCAHLRHCRDMGVDPVDQAVKDSATA